ncbi:SIMPL domain-containing protein [Membranicola marinus]|uniref:SIMPL domain-containing protein n=1 Tax=Membranihabitans marinus TaxID=1227546 RepID=A0A953L8T4_9BACT|nr:SIMPL domain-containing protein [Membranihabitans marinus]MBY5958065.1 SIMPL domain-containing protein [Membranihabitans marinus]
MSRNFIPAALILGIAVIIASWIFGTKFYESRFSDRYVSVKGLSEMEVKATLASWTLESRIDGPSFENVKQEVNSQANIILNWLQGKGFTKTEIKIEDVSVSRNYYQQGQPPFNGSVRVSLQTKNVDLLEEISGLTTELLDQGVFLSGDRWSNRPRYYFTGVNDIKPELLRKATQAALESAEQFADNSGAEVGDIKYANQGIIVLLPGNRIEESHEFYKDKIARVVASLDYYIE